MVLSPKLSQIYSFCFNKSLFDTQFSGFIPIDFTKFKRQMVNMNDFEQLVARKRYTYLGHCILGWLGSAIPGLHPWKLEF